MAKKFFYVCAGIFLLALSYHFGAGTATAQIGGNTVVATIYGVSPVGTSYSVFTSGGDVFVSTSGHPTGPYSLMGNVFSGGPVQTRQSTFGQVKVGDR